MAFHYPYRSPPTHRSYRRPAERRGKQPFSPRCPCSVRSGSPMIGRVGCGIAGITAPLRCSMASHNRGCQGFAQLQSPSSPPTGTESLACRAPLQRTYRRPQPSFTSTLTPTHPQPRGVLVQAGKAVLRVPRVEAITAIGPRGNHTLLSARRPRRRITISRSKKHTYLIMLRPAMHAIILPRSHAGGDAAPGTGHCEPH